MKICGAGIAEKILNGESFFLTVEKYSSYRTDYAMRGYTTKREAQAGFDRFKREDNITRRAKLFKHVPGEPLETIEEYERG